MLACQHPEGNAVIAGSEAATQSRRPLLSRDGDILQASDLDRTRPRDMLKSVKQLVSCPYPGRSECPRKRLTRLS